MGQCVVFEGAGRPLQICSMPVPQPRRGEILVRNEYATLCRSDLSTYAGRRLEAVPTILGHEVVGRIVALGEQVPERDLLASGWRSAIGWRGRSMRAIRGTRWRGAACRRRCPAC